jgi:hypothetical protein
MDIGREKRTIYIEPIEDPAPEIDEPSPEPATPADPQSVPSP